MALIERLIRSLPIVGFAIECLERGHTGRLAVVAANVAMTTILLTLIFGFPGFMLVLLGAVAVVALVIFSATLG